MRCRLAARWVRILCVVCALNQFAKFAAGKSSTMTFQIDGAERTALVYVPDKINQTSIPLVFAFHGHGGTSQAAERKFEIDRLWPDAISVYPQGLNTPGTLTDPNGEQPGWQHELGDGDRDLHFFDAMLARLKKEYPVDDRQIFCTGHSNGAGFTYLLWRHRPDIFAAFAPCSGAARYVMELKPKPAMILAGRNDQLVLFDWTQRMIEAVQAIDECDAAGQPWEKIGTQYPSARGTPLVTYIYDGGHPMDTNEPALIVKFFQQHPMATTRPTTMPN